MVLSIIWLEKTLRINAMNKHFIKATEEYCTLDKWVAAPYMRRAFNLAAKPERAEISVCGLGFYVLYVNGTDITKGRLAPYISNPDHNCYYDTYDIAEYLTEGENVIGLMLGNGFMNCLGGFVWDFDKAEFRGAPRVALELSATVGGDEIVIEADGEFLCHPSPVLFDDLRMGEVYDAGREIPGWNLPGFDASGWSFALPAETPRGELMRCTAEPIVTLREVKPVKIFREGDAFIYDFGTNSAGLCKLKIKGERGQTVTMWHSELIRDGRFYNDNIRFYGSGREAYEVWNQTDKFICSGGEDEYMPHFRYNGFRYVKVEGITERQATEELLTYHVMSSGLSVIGGFSCSDERLNTLYKMVDNANRSNFFYYPTDCPHREKNGWTGDASISADNMMLMYDTEASWREWLRNIVKAQDSDGALPGIVPTAGWGFAWGNGPAWDSVLFTLPYTLYKMRGCTDVVLECAPAMVKYLSYILTRRGKDGTVAVGLGDWVPVNKPADRYAPPLAFTDSVMVMDMARKAAEMFGAVGYSHQSSFAEAIYNDMRATVRRELVDLNTMLVAGNCQSSQAIALYYGVFDSDEKDMAFGQLLRLIEEKDYAFDCGFLGMHCIFHVLSEGGKSDVAYRMITRDSFPSYTLLIEEGHTAIPEHFLDESHNPPSLNHHFLGDISRWFTIRLAGLNVLDYKTVRIAPCPVDGVNYAEAYHDLPSGRVSVRWDRTPDGGISVNYTAPEGVKVILD